MFKLTINIVILFLTAWNCICVFRVFRVLKAVINVWGCYYYWQASPQSQVLHCFCVCGFLLVVFLCLFFVSFISQRTVFFFYLRDKLTKLPLFNKFLLLWVAINCRASASHNQSRTQGSWTLDNREIYTCPLRPDSGLSSRLLLAWCPISNRPRTAWTGWAWAELPWTCCTRLWDIPVRIRELQGRCQTDDYVNWRCNILRRGGNRFTFLFHEKAL